MTATYLLGFSLLTLPTILGLILGCFLDQGFKDNGNLRDDIYSSLGIILGFILGCFFCFYFGIFLETFSSLIFLLGLNLMALGLSRLISRYCP